MERRVTDQLLFSYQSFMWVTTHTLKDENRETRVASEILFTEEQNVTVLSIGKTLHLVIH